MHWQMSISHQIRFSAPDSLSPSVMQDRSPTSAFRTLIPRCAVLALATVFFGLGLAVAPPTALGQYVDDKTIAPNNPDIDERFGSAVANVGSGILIVGAKDGGGQGNKTEPGQAYLVDASTGSVPTTIYSQNETTQGRFGAAVGVTEDGNGTPYVIVGAPREDAPKTATIANEGVAYVFDGTDGSFVTKLQATTGNIEDGGRFGAAVAGIADVNSDGVPDVVVGAPGQNGGSGKAYVFSGAKVFDADNSGGAPIKVLTGAGVSSGNFGASLTPVGDLLASDGTGDFVVGAPGEAGGDGQVYFVDGSSVTGTVNTTTVGSPNGGGRFGAAVDSFGTVGDRDVVVGAPAEPGGGVSGSGRAYIVDGANLSGTPTALESPNPEASPTTGDFGLSVAGIEDVNGNGTSDVLIGAPGETINSGNDREGRAYVFDGATGSFIDEIVSPNVTDGGEFGIAVAGLPKPVIGARQENGSSTTQAGRIYTFRLLEVALMDGRDGESYSPSSPLSAGSDENAVGRFKLSASDPGATLESVTVENDAGTPLTGVNAIELWASTNSTFEPGTDTQLKSPSYSNSVTFSDLGQPIPAGDIYLFVVVDLASDAEGDYDPVIRSESDLTLSDGLLAEVNGTRTSTFTDAYLSATGTTLNAAPTIDALSDQTVRQGEQPDPVSLTVGDEETDSDQLTLSASSDNTTLVPASGLTVNGPDAGGNGSLQVDLADGESGTATITVTVEDTGGKTASSSFVLQVAPGTVSASVSRSFGDANGPGDYRLVALPGQVSQPLGPVVSGEAGVTWQAYRDNGNSSDFLVKYDGSDDFTFKAGNGFWLTSTKPWTETSNFSAVDLQDGVAEIPLRDGWNVISNPLGKDVSWSAVKAENSGTLQPLWGFDGSFGKASTFASAADGTAYYFFNDQGLSTLQIPYPSPSKSKAGPIAESNTNTKETKDRVLTLTARRAEAPDSAGATGSTVRVGLHPDAERSVGPTDVPAPPGRFSAVALRVKAPSGNGPQKARSERTRSERMRTLMAERRPASEMGEGYTYSLRLHRQGEGPVTMDVGGVEAFSGRSVALVDPASGASYDLRKTGTVEVPASAFGPEGGAALTVAVGTEGYVQEKARAARPSEVTLTAYPNPVREQGTLEYTLPEAAEVSLRVYDVLGRRVQTLASGRVEAGRHTATLPTSGLSSGVYIARLRAGGTTVTRKITVVR